MVLDPENPDKKALLGADISDQIRPGLVSFLKSQSSNFAWSHTDMTEIDPKVITHRLNIDPIFTPVRQKRRKYSVEKNAAVNSEVQKLLDTEMIREVMYPKWLANVVVVPKKNRKWRVCVDYTDLNKACPKDSFPLPI